MNRDSGRSRRAFLKFLAASPLYMGSGFGRTSSLNQNAAPPSAADFVISDPAQAINVLEFEAAAQKALPPAHWG
ncbi:MAG: hypothetical protein ABI868_25885, partial [Acidobacteriota bacterium]